MVKGKRELKYTKTYSFNTNIKFTLGGTTIGESQLPFCHKNSILAVYNVLLPT
jgi:hypothetical protein